jgi:hypothetical protein
MPYSFLYSNFFFDGAKIIKSVKNEHFLMFFGEKFNRIILIPALLRQLYSSEE